MHIPVLQDETIKYLDPKPNENFIDCTVGSGGHAEAILERTAPKGRLLGIDLDESQISSFAKATADKKNLKERLVLVNDNYASLKEIVERRKFKNISGILLDLGFSSFHVDESKRGFTFLKSEPLDMRYDQLSPLTAEKILNYWSGQEIEKIFRELGQEPFSSQIAKEIIEARRVIRIKNTMQLVEIIKRAVPSNYRKQKTHFATKTFQALRIAVNGELENLKKVLPQAEGLLESGGRLAIISFHSLEDKIVKEFLKNKSERGKLKILTAKPVQAQEVEVVSNPRARSAKLRAAIKI